MINLAINVGGHHKIGTGHVYRQIAMMEEKPDYNYLFLITKTQVLAKNVLEENLIEYNYYESHDDFLKLLKKNKIDIVINDILDTDETFIKLLKQNNYFIVNYEDRGKGHDHADIVINDMYPIDNYKELDNVYVGSEFTCMRRDLVLYSAKPFNPTPKKLIITFGGSDPCNYTKRVLDLILEKNINKLVQVVIILGLGYKYDNEIMKHRSDNIKVFKNIKNMASILRKGDIAITSNGRTLLELSYFEVPCISLAQNERESTHVHAKLENGILFLGRDYEFTNEILYEKLNRLLTDNKFRLMLSTRMKKVKEKLLNSNKKIWNLIELKYSTMTTKKVSLFSRAKDNSGDQLIVKSTKGLLEYLGYEVLIIQEGWKKISDKDLQIINNTQKLFIPGGPCVQNDIYPRIYPFRKNLKDITAEIVLFGGGLGIKTEINDFKINDKTVNFLNNHKIFTRDKLTRDLLKKNNVESIFSGCSVWYNSGNLVNYFKDVKSGTILFSAQRKTSELDINILHILINKFPNNEIVCSLNHGFENNISKNFINFCKEKKIKLIDLKRNSQKMMELAKNVDMHIGLRVHSHLASLSVGTKSILIHIDIRGVAMSDAIGTSIFDIDKKNLHKLSKNIDNAIKHDYKQVVDIIHTKFKEIKDIL